MKFRKMLDANTTLAAALLLACAGLASCGGGDVPAAISGGSGRGSEYVDRDEDADLAAAAADRALSEDLLADRINAEALGLSLQSADRVDLSSVNVSYAVQTPLTRTAYFDVPVKAEPIPIGSARVLSAAQNYPAYGAKFDFYDIRLQPGQTGQVALINNTPRTFRQMLWRKTDGTVVGLGFGDQAIQPFTTNFLQTAALSGTETFVDTASLFRPVGFQFEAGLSESCAGVAGKCRRRGTPAEQRRLESTLVKMKLAYNTNGMDAWSTAFAKGGCLSSYQAACTSMGSDPELYMWTSIGKMSLMPKTVMQLSYLVNFGNIIGLAGGSWMAFTPKAAGSLNTIHHEIAHNYGYNHASGMTYGFSPLINSKLGNANIHVEALPKRAVIAKPALQRNTWVISVLSTEAESLKAVRFMLLAMETDFSASVGRIAGYDNQFVLKFDRPLKFPFAIKVYPDSAQESDLIGSVVLYPN